MRAISDDAADYGYNDLEYEYNADGLLVGKTELEYPYYHQYYYDGDRMIAEVWESEALFFLYDSTGIIGMQYWYDEELLGTYWFEKNLQGDVVAIYDDAGVLQLTYDYDAWGNFTQTRHVSYTYAYMNPFKYRGYYYDYDLEMYYLQTRYYDSTTGRFISPDSALYHNMVGYNMFAYCKNNHVNYVDYTGEFAISISAALLSIGTIIVQSIATSAVITVAVVGAIEIGEALGEAIANANQEDEEAPKSVTESPSESDTNEQNKVNPSSPRKMQNEIDKNQAPKDVKRVDNPKNGKPHIHFKDGTGLNNDGTVHDAHKGLPKLSNSVKKWLKKHNWPTELRLFP